MMESDRHILRLYVTPSTKKSAICRLSKLFVEFADIYQPEIVELPDGEPTPNADGVNSMPALVIDKGSERQVRTGSLKDERAVRRFLLGYQPASECADLNRPLH